MKYLQILNAALAALGFALGLVLAVVCVFYWVHLDLEPRLGRELPQLIGGVAAFGGLAAACVLPFVAHRRAWAARWLLQVLPVVPLAGIALFVASLRD